MHGVFQTGSYTVSFSIIGFQRLCILLRGRQIGGRLPPEMKMPAANKVTINTSCSMYYTMHRQILNS